MRSDLFRLSCLPFSTIRLWSESLNLQRAVLSAIFPTVSSVSIIIDGFKDFDIHNCPTPMNPISGTLFRTLGPIRTILFYFFIIFSTRFQLFCLGQIKVQLYTFGMRSIMPKVHCFVSGVPELRNEASQSLSVRYNSKTTA